MKRTILFALFACLLLCACQSQTADTDQITKAQAITILSADGQTLGQVTSQEDLDAFFLALDLDRWTLASLPQEAACLGTFVFSQTPTVLFGQTQAEDTRDIATLTAYDAPYITLTLAGLDLTFAIPQKAADALAGYVA